MKKLLILKLKSKYNKKIKIIIIIPIFVLGFFSFEQKIDGYDKKDKKFVITEIMYNVDKNNTDWVEILALKDFVIDDNWRVFDENKNKLKKSEKTGKYLKCHKLKNINNIIEIKKGERVVFVDNINKFKKQYPNYDGKIIDTILNLQNRNKDAVMISDDKCLSFVDFFEYDPKKWQIKKGYSLEYELKNKKWRKSYLLGGTPGEENSKKPKPKKYKKHIRINEILPNPKGDEKESEFIELYNFGANDIDLENWVIKDDSKKGLYVFPKNTILKAGEFFVIYRNEFKFALNNSGKEKVFLLNPSGEKVFEIGYKNAKENISYGFDDKNGKWRWSDKLSPGKINQFSAIPEIRMKIGKKRYKNVYIDFTVKVVNVKNDKFKMRWDFGDERRSYKIKTKHKYQKAGIYDGFVEILKSGEVFRKIFRIEIKKFPRRKIKITAIMPNPKGVDRNSEWIEIKNNSKKKINLKGWSIATGVSKKKMVNHPIYDDFIIKPGKTRKITGKYSHFSLNNKKCRVEIRYPDGKIAYFLKYKKEGGIKEEEIYKKKKGGNWFWVENNVATETKKIFEPAENFNKKDNKILNNISDLNIENNLKKQSLTNKHKKMILKDFAVFEKVENDKSFTLKKNRFVLGVNDTGKIREENGFYYFTSKGKSEEHWFKKNLKTFFQKYLRLLRPPAK